MADKTIEERWSEVHQLTTNINVASAASKAYHTMLRAMREVLDIESELNKPNEELMQQIGDCIDTAQIRRNKFDEWLAKNEPILHEKVSALTNGD